MNTNTQETRRERWRKHITKKLEALAGLDAFTPPEWLEEIEGRPIADVILDAMSRDRGFGIAEPTPDQQYRAEIDNGFERNATTRGRNAHERDVAELFVVAFLDRHGQHVPGDRLRELVRKFYRKGDFGLGAAIRRAILAGLDASKC